MCAKASVPGTGGYGGSAGLRTPKPQLASKARSYKVLNAEEYDGQAAGEYGRSGDGVGVAFEGSDVDLFQPLQRERDGQQHGRHRNETEDTGDQQDAEQAFTCGRVHQQRNQRLAGAEHKYDENHPWCKRSASRGRLVNVRMRSVVGMHVTVSDAVMAVPVRMWAVSRGLSKSPGRVSQAETDQQPGGKVTADAFQPLERNELGAKRDTGQAQRDRAHQVPDAAQKGDSQGSGHRPAARLRHRDERQVVVRPEHRVRERDGGRG